MKYKPRPHRSDKMNALLREEIGKIILKELDIDKNMLLTITKAETSSDLTHATIFFSTLLVKDEGEVQKILHDQTRIIQHILNRKLRTRPIPYIRFTLDKGVKIEQRVHDLLSDLP